MFLFLSYLHAEPIVLNHKLQNYNVLPNVEIYIDKNNNTTIDELINKQFTFIQNTKELLYYHFNHSAFWFRFSIQNDQTQVQNYRLTIPTSWLDKVIFYTLNADGTCTEQISGDRVKYEQKSIKNRSIVFSLSIPKGLNHYYIKVKSNDALQLPIFLTQEQFFQEDEDKLNIYFAFLTGVILMMILYAFFYFIYLKDSLYGIYMGYIFTFILMVLSTHGYLLHYLYRDAFAFNEWIYEFSFIGYLGFMVWFAKEFLEVEHFSPRWNSFLKYLALAHLGILILSPILPYPLVMELGVYSGSITPFILIIPAVLSIKHNKIQTKFYLLGWSINIGSYTLWALGFFAILPYNIFINNANSIGVLFELLIFSLGLVYRVVTLIKSNNKLNTDIRIDALTQVLNRYAFNIEFPLQLKDVRKNGQVFFFAMLDIDNFKLYNDTYGHPQGDEALKRVALILAKQLQRRCDKVYRVGGEEFALVLCEENMSKAHHSIESLRKAIEEEKILFEHSDHNVLTASFGLVGISNKDLDYKEIYKQADMLLYKAKANGRNCVISKEIL